MKTTIKTLLGCALFASITITSFGQAPMTPINEGGKKPEPIEKTKIPVVVTKTYVVEYPVTSTETWYGYPAFTDASSDWYGYDPYIVVPQDQQPEYYIVEFTSDKTRHKAIYSKDGKKVATHKVINGDVPKAVSDALNKSAYKAWTVKQEKEEIWKDSDKNNTKVYKVVVEKGSEKHCLFFQPNGTLIKDKKDK